MTIIIGIDPSSKKVAMVACDETGRLLGATMAWLPDVSDIVTRADWAEKQTNKFVSSFRGYTGHDVVVFIESPIGGRGGMRTTIVQARVSGGILIGARRGGAKEIHDVHHGTWKRDVLGNGSYPKTKIPKYVADTWPVLYEKIKGDPDGCDAACIATYGQKVVTKAIKRTTAVRKPRARKK